MSARQSTAANELSVSGVIEHIIFRADDSDFAVAVLSLAEEKETVRLAGDLGDIEVGETVAVMGKLVNDGSLAGRAPWNLGLSTRSLTRGTWA